MLDRRRARRHDQAAIRGLCEGRDGALDSDASPTPTGRNSTPTDGAKAWMAPNCPLPRASAASRNTAARVTRGEISLSSSSHFPSMLYSNGIKPVALPPGRARFST